MPISSKSLFHLKVEVKSDVDHAEALFAGPSLEFSVAPLAYPAH